MLMSAFQVDQVAFFQSKPGKIHARFNYFEQLYESLISEPAKAASLRVWPFSFLRQLLSLSGKLIE